MRRVMESVARANGIAEDRIVFLDKAVAELDGSGRRFDRKKFGLSFGLKNGLRFHFDSMTCLNYQFLNFFLVNKVNLKPKLKWFFKL